MNNKTLIIVYISVLIFLYGCTPEYGRLNRSMLDDKRDLQFWDYYHSVDYCSRIDIIDSVFSFVINIENNDKLKYKEKYGILDNQLYDIAPNSFYGYMFFDLYEKTDTLCCVDVVLSGQFLMFSFVDHEAPPDFKNIENLKKNIKLWKEKLNCE